MSTYRLWIAPALLLVGCMQNDPAQSTFPQQPQQQQSGPPGGQMDPQYGQQPPPGYGQQPQYAQPQGPQSADPYTGDVNGDAQGQEAGPPQDPNQQDLNGQGQGQVDPNQDPSANQGAMGDVDDNEIDQTLSPYGQWSDDDGQRVWYPDQSTVGMDFTPYDTDGGWIWTDAGWSFNCGYNWGWLPFHYGRWGWFGGRWGWFPGHQWGAAWVDWRHGNGLVGWRPMGPNGAHGVGMHDSHWNFTHENELGSAHIHGHLTNNPAEGLRNTQGVSRLPTRGNYTPVASSSLMRNRMTSPHYAGNTGFRGNSGGNSGPVGVPQRSNIRSQSAQQSFRSQQPTYRQQSQPSYRAPSQSYRSNGPSRSFNAPSRSFSAPSRSYSSHSSVSHSAPSHSFGGGSHSFGGGHSGGGGGGHHR
jgi:hypothetical protein